MLTWLKTRFELSRKSSGNNLRAMEGMRGLAVMLVFLTHFCTLIAPWLMPTSGVAAFARHVHTVGNAGVDLFFVLSGYLIYKTLLLREQNFASFMARRIRRIYPTFFTVFLIYGVLSYVFPSESSIPHDAPSAYLAANLLLLPGLFPIKPMITVAWSLSYEMFFYLCLPFVVTALRLRRRTGAQRVTVILLLAAVPAAWAAVADNGHVRMTMFMSGMLVHEAIHRRARAPAGAVAACALAAGLSSCLLPIVGHVKTMVLFVSFYLVCTHCFLCPSGRLTRLFCWTPLRWFGNMSYSYYLLHGLALKTLFMLLPSPAALSEHPLALFFLLLPAAFVLTLLVSSGLYLLVERPLSLDVVGAPAATIPT